jgi:hypothetical protein
MEVVLELLNKGADINAAGYLLVQNEILTFIVPILRLTEYISTL